MSVLKRSSLAVFMFAAFAIPVLASVTVNTPTNGETVSPQFTLIADATTCSSQPVSAMGFSLDSSSNTTIVKSTSIDATVTATTGAHTLHVKAWGDAGASCVTDVAITVGATSGTSSGVSVTTPGNNATVTSPFTLTADAVTCSSQPVSAMSFWIDSGSATTVNATAINTKVSSPSGAHTLHVKATGNAGASCVSNIAINVSAPATTSPTPPPTTTTSGVAVSQPLNNSTVTSPFVLDATATTCSSQPVSAMGYSLDNSTSTATVKGTSVAASVTAAAGAHTLHVKAWGNAGAACHTIVAITVGAAASAPTTTTSTPTITSPASGASVNSPFNVVASESTCASQTVTSMGYSIDSGSFTISTGASINTQATATAGQHTLNVKAWNSAGGACSASVAIDVLGASSPTNSLLPSNAKSVSSIQTMSGWQEQHDPATGATSSGSMSMVSSPSLSGNARRFNTSFTSSGGEIYHITFGDDAAVTNFFYDAWVYLTSSASNIANVEMDMNQVMSNGQTVIYGFQCDGYSGTWDYTENTGTPTKPSDHWVHSSAACNPRNWTRNAWHHIQISYSRDSVGKVTYHAVWFDGVEHAINATVPSSFALGWGQVLLTNFQIDGLGTGSDTVYLDKLVISRW